MSMLRRKLLYVSCLFLCLFLSLSFVCAEDNNTIDDELGIRDSQNMTVTDSYPDLENEIDNAQDRLVLNKSYDLANNTSGILINKSICIEGNNFCINANNTDRIFNITSDNVTLKNIVFKCGEAKNFNIITSDSQKDGIFYWTGNNGSIINCTFVYAEYSLNSATFNDLTNEINNALDVLVLDRDYVFSKEFTYNHIDSASVDNGELMRGISIGLMKVGHDEEGIIINKTITIDGRGHVLDGRGKSRIFKVINGSVIFKNIIFKDGSSDKGAAIYGQSLVINSTFESNYCRNNLRYQEVTASIYGLISSPFYYLTIYGGAVYNVNATNCTFKSNHADYGGAMYGGNAFNCTFKSNHADYGGAMYGGNAFNCSFANNNVYRYGGAMYGGNAFNCSFLSNNAFENGGAISNIFAFNCTFINNSASYGGAFYEGSCDFCTFINNTASINGGAVCAHRHHNNVFSGDKISNSVFINNSAGCDGGAVWGLRDHALNSKIDNCTFISNKAMENGGAVYVAIIHNSTFINNTALNGQDAYESIISLVSSINASNSTFVSLNTTKSFLDLDNLINSNNESEIYLDEDYSFDLTKDFKYLDEGIRMNRSVIIHGNNHELNANNFARFFNVFGDVVFENIRFKNGKTSGNGGAINGLCIVLNSTFTDNFAYGVGGALYGVNCFNSSFINNSAAHGGAVSCSNIYGSTFLNNSADDAGAALECNVYNSYFAFNHCGGNGGAMWFGKSVNCVFENNHAQEGGAIYESLAINSTFISNSAGYGGAMYNGNAFNCLFTNNSVFYHHYGNVFYGDGGAMFRGSAFNCSFVNNNAFYNGGGIFKGSAFNCSFINNHANNGGAVYIDFDTNFIFKQGTFYIPINATVDNCYFENNTSNESGGAICTFENNTVIRDSVFVNNNAKLGKDIYSDLLSIKIIKSKFDSLYIHQDNSTRSSADFNNEIKKVSPKIIAKNKSFNKKTKIKKYSITLKNKRKALKNTRVSLKIKNRLFKAKTNSKGKTTFKITKFNKKAKYNAKIIFKGNKYYKRVNKTVKIIIK